MKRLREYSGCDLQTARLEVQGERTNTLTQPCFCEPENFSNDSRLSRTVFKCHQGLVGPFDVRVSYFRLLCC